MSKEIAIVIPSANRAQSVLTKIANAILYVPEHQADEYSKHNPEYKIETHKQHKNLAEKRNEIYQRYKNVFMVDDDIYTIVRTNTEGNNRENPLTPEEAEILIYKTADTAHSAGCYIFGFNSRPTPAHYQSHTPIRLTAYINASAIGMLQSDKLYFSTNLIAAESYWINLLNAHFYRKSWCDTRFCFAQKPNSTFTAPGGQAEHRTLDSEKQDSLHLKKMFGAAIQQKKNTSQSKARHPYQRIIKLPF